MVQQQVHCTSGSSPMHQFQILPSGKMPKTEDLVIQDMPENIGRVYIFNTALDPSFKMMHTSNEAVSTISWVACIINFLWAVLYIYITDIFCVPMWPATGPIKSPRRERFVENRNKCSCTHPVCLSYVTSHTPWAAQVSFLKEFCN